MSRLLVLFALVALSHACSHTTPEDSAGAAAPAPDTVATVNGTAITEADIALLGQNRGHEERAADAEHGEDPSLTAAQKKQILDTLVRDELIAQRATELGLDADPEYRRQLGRMQATLAKFRREKLGALFERHQREHLQISDAEVRRYFDAHAAELQTEFHVLQILTRDQGEADRVRREIDGGTSFEDAARSRFPSLPEGTHAPWDLGWLRYTQLPEPWRGVVDRLEPGASTDVLAGPRGRFWLVKLVAKRRNTDIGYDVWKAHITEILRTEKLDAQRAQTERALRSKARVVFTKRAP